MPMWSRARRSRGTNRGRSFGRGPGRPSGRRSWGPKGHRSIPRSYNSDFPPAPRELYRSDNTRLSVRLARDEDYKVEDKDNTKSKSLRYLRELDVGITEYISDSDGFKGVLKARYSDFHVNEIDLDGNVAVLTDLTVPPDPVPEDDTDESLIDRYRIEQIPTDTWDKIHKLIETNNFREIIEIDVTALTKTDRTKIYEAVKTVFGQRIVGTTVNKNEKKFVTFKLYNKNDRVDKREKWPKHRSGEFVHFLVHKENTDTIEASFQIADSLAVRPNNFNYAGVKDRRAKTTQWFSVKKIDPRRIIESTKHLKNIHIGNFCYKQEALKLGQLKGNQFQIAIRNINVDNKIVDRAMDSLKNHGFINYYGLQRFGNCKDVPTCDIGLKLLTGNWKEAVNLILQPKKFERNVILEEAKKLYMKSHDANQALQLLRKRNLQSIEGKLLAGLAKHSKEDYVNALENLPRNIRLLYIHAFQSMIWNKIVSKRLKYFGLKPIVGDLVLDDNAQQQAEFIEKTLDSVAEEEEEDTNWDKTGNETPAEQMIKVKVLRESDLSKYTVYDVVLPLPGYDITYPENIVKCWYKDILIQNGLSLEMRKQKVKLYSLSGAYRKIVERVSNLSWKVTKYNDPHTILIRSDYEKMVGKIEPEKVENGSCKALLINFCLSSSCYATMVLREVMKMDTSVETHINFEKTTNSELDSAKDTAETSKDNTESDNIEIKTESNLEIKEEISVKSESVPIKLEPDLINVNCKVENEISQIEEVNETDNSVLVGDKRKVLDNSEDVDAKKIKLEICE